jgi:flagellar assembly factor FliW
MLLVDPYRFFGDYVFEVNDKLAKEFGFTADNPPHVFSVVTLKDQIEDATVNLSAPVLVNWIGRIGVQLVLTQPAYSLRQRLFPDGLPQVKDIPVKKAKTKPGTDFVPQQEAI